MAAIEFQKQFCGEVFVTTNYVVMLECKFCFEQFGVYEEFLNHIFDNHFDNIDECKNYMDEDEDMDILNEFERANGGVAALDATTDGTENRYDPDLYLSNQCSPSTSQNLPSAHSRLQTRQAAERYFSNENAQSKESNEQYAEISTTIVIEKVDVKQLASNYKKQPKSYEQQQDSNRQTRVQPNIRPETSTSNTLQRAHVKEFKVHQKHRQDSKLQTSTQNIRPVISRNNAKKGIERKFKCKFCDRGFNNRWCLHCHEQRHLNNKPFACTKCNKAFFSRGELQKHTRSHTGERPFICPYCGKGFTTSSILKQHELRHLNKRKFKCDQCDKRFFTGPYLRNHMVTHTGERNFICKECNKAFTRIGALRNHRKLHENALRYECNICHMRFNQKPTLLWHKRTKHELVLGADAEKANNVLVIKQTNGTTINDTPSVNDEEYQYIRNEIENAESYGEVETDLMSNFLISIG